MTQTAPSNHISQLELVINIYSTSNKELALKVESHLAECKICQERDQSLRDFDNTLHAFLSGEDIGPKIEELMKKLDDDEELIKEAEEIMKRAQSRKNV